MSGLALFIFAVSLPCSGMHAVQDTFDTSTAHEDPSKVAPVAVPRPVASPMNSFPKHPVEEDYPNDIQTPVTSQNWV